VIAGKFTDKKLLEGRKCNLDLPERNRRKIMTK